MTQSHEKSAIVTITIHHFLNLNKLTLFCLLRASLIFFAAGFFERRCFWGVRGPNPSLPKSLPDIFATFERGQTRCGLMFSKSLILPSIIADTDTLIAMVVSILHRDVRVNAPVS